MPAVITVTTAADDLTPNDGTVSLREAITAINAGNDLGDPDVIAQHPGTFGSNDAIHFNIPGAGVHTIHLLGSTLDIKNALTIDGTGSGITINGGGNRVFTIETGKVVINGLTITGGIAPSSASGGGIYNKGFLSLSNSTVTGNSADNSAGVYNDITGTMFMSGDTVNNNTATASVGGGVGNVGTLEIINCTIAANNANRGGGIANTGVLSVSNSTVAFNTVTGAGSDGGGIDTFGGSDQLSLLNTIVYNSNSGATTTNEVLGTNAQAQSLIYGPGPYKVAPGGDHGGSFIGFDPKLGPLQNNGGDTATMALLPGSPAIGHGATMSMIPGLGGWWRSISVATRALPIALTSAPSRR